MRLLLLALLSATAKPPRSAPPKPIWQHLAASELRCEPSSNLYVVRVNCKVPRAEAAIRAKGDAQARETAIAELTDLIRRTQDFKACGGPSVRKCDFEYRGLDWFKYRVAMRMIGEVGTTRDSRLVETTFNSLSQFGGAFLDSVGPTRELPIAWLKLSEPTLSGEDALRWAIEYWRSAKSSPLMDAVAGDIIATYWTTVEKPWNDTLVAGLSDSGPKVRQMLAGTTRIDLPSMPEKALNAFLPLLDDSNEIVRHLARVALQARVCISKWKVQLQQYANSPRASPETKVLILGAVREKGAVQCETVR